MDMIVDRLMIARRVIAAALLALALAGCSGESERAAPAPAETRPAAQEAPPPEPAMVATPTGILGSIVDRRSSLPAGYDAPAGDLDPARAYGHVVRIGPGEPTLRFLVWNAHPASSEGDPMLAAYAIEVTDNPGGHEITWTTVEDRGTDVDLRIQSERIEGRSIVGQTVRGTLSARGGLFTPTR